jgi:AraC family transcriptional regulator
MDVQIVSFPETKVAAIEHFGAPALEHDTVRKLIAWKRCALARDIGSRQNNKAAIWLCEEWLPRSGAAPGNFPIFFHYVNVGPHVRDQEMITDVYLPLR